jgi:thioredoxin reductase (NADPH)
VMTLQASSRRPPTILSVDDEPAVLDAVVADLRERYGERYRVTGAASGADAVAIVEHLTRRGDELALVVADQRMPGMSGVELLAAVKGLQPRLRSILLTAYADTDAAIAAINEVDLDHYITKPWDPPAERLYPVTDELLEAWEATRPPQMGGVRVVGDRWSPGSHELRDFLARNLVPFRWLDVDSTEGSSLAAASGASPLPLLVLEDGRVLAAPDRAQVAAALGTATQPEVEVYDLVVVGAGPSGLAAAVYGGSEGLRSLVVEAEAPGGQAALSSSIENYLGFPSGIAGAELTRRALAQARRFGVSVVSPRRAVRLQRADPYRLVELDDGTQVHASTVIVASGVQYRRLEVEGIDALTGAGVYYGAASTEAAAMQDERVLVIGGANSAGQAAMHLANFAAEVHIVVRGRSLRDRMSSYLVDRIEAEPSVRVRTGSQVTRVAGDGRLEQVEIEDATGDRARLDVTGMFVFIGAHPRTEWLGEQVVTDDRGFVVTGRDLTPDRWALERDPFLLETSVPGVFAVGDVRAASVKRVASAVGEGSVAVQFVHEVLRGA